MAPCARTRRSRTAVLVCAILLAASGSLPGRLLADGLADDFAAGFAAYDAGDLRGAYEAWLPLARSGDSRAQVALAGLLESGGPGLPRDLPAAADWYRRAAEAGDPVAQMNLAQFHVEGKGVERDLQQALVWYMLAANQGRGWAAAQRDRVAGRLGPAARAAAAEQAKALRDNRM